MNGTVRLQFDIVCPEGESWRIETYSLADVDAARCPRCGEPVKVAGGTARIEPRKPLARAAGRTQPVTR